MIFFIYIIITNSCLNFDNLFIDALKMDENKFENTAIGDAEWPYVEFDLFIFSESLGK